MMIHEITPAELEGILFGGEICLVLGDDSALGEAIRFGQSLESGEVATFGHAMIYAGKGELISPEQRVVKRTFHDYVGKTLRFWGIGASIHRFSQVRGADTVMARNRIIDTARLQLGRRYDYLGLVGQLIRGLLARIGLPKVGKKLGGLIQRPSRWFCSEMVAYCYRREYPEFCNQNKQPSPQDIDDWCAATDGWKRVTVRIVAAEAAER